MRNMTDVLDSLVRELKTHIELDTVRFVHAGKVSAAENPISSFVAACEVKSFSVKNTEAHKNNVQGKLLFTLYAPRGVHKRELDELTVVFASLIEESSLKESISGIACMEATFDKNSDTWYREITVDIECDENSVSENIEAEIEGLGVFAVKEIKEISKPERYELCELMSGVVGYCELKEKNSLWIVLLGDVTLSRNTFDLTLSSASAVYEGCTVVKITKSITDDKSVSTEILLNFESKKSEEDANG